MATSESKPAEDRAESKNLHLTELAYVVASGFVAFTVPPSRAWHLHFPFALVASLIVIAAAAELGHARMVQKRSPPIFATVSLLGGLALIPFGAVIRSPLLLPDDGKVRVAVMMFSPGEPGEHFTDRLVLTLKRARDAGLPIEIVEVGTTATGSTERAQESFAIRAGRALPISAHIVLWGRVVTDVPPYYTTANITLANNLFARESHGYRDAPWLEIASFEGRDHPRDWPRTTFQTDSAAKLDTLLGRQTAYINELVAFVGGLALLESRQYKSVLQSLPANPTSFNLGYLRAVASLEASVDSMLSWLEHHGDFFMHAPPPNEVISPIEGAVQEFDRLLSSTGNHDVRHAQGLTWYAHYTRARAKQMHLHLRRLGPPEELSELQNLFEDLAESAKRNQNRIAETRAFLEAGGYQLALADSATRPKLADSLYAALQKLLSHHGMPPEIRATIYYRQGQLCSDSDDLPEGCAVGAYQSARRLFRSLSLPHAEADVHQALGDYYRDQQTKQSLAQAIRHYSSALQIHSRTPYANVGTRAGDAWWLLQAVQAYHDGRIPTSKIPALYDFIMGNVFGTEAVWIRGVGDLYLQEALTGMKARACEEVLSDRDCWTKVIHHTDAILLNQLITLDDPRIARYRAIHARAAWELAAIDNAGRNKIAPAAIYQDFLDAIAHNNMAGGAPEALVQIGKLYQRMRWSTSTPDLLDARIMTIVRHQCLTTGKSLWIAPGDTFATQLHLALPNTSKLSANNCSATSLAEAFTPLEYVVPQWSVVPPSIDSFVQTATE